MHRIAQRRRQMIDQHVDADMRARGERMRERPRDAEGERIAGDLGGRLRREAEEAPAMTSNVMKAAQRMNPHPAT